MEVTFSFQNVSGKPVTLLDVRPQCGCTVPVYSRSAVGPGKKGTVKVTFDPSQTYGEQKRYLTVVSTNGDYRKLNTIQVHGYVRRDQTPSEIRFPFHLGAGIRTELETVGLRRRTAGEVVRRSIVLYNDSQVPVTLSWVLSIFTWISPLSSTTGSPLFSSSRMVPTLTESTDPAKWN